MANPTVSSNADVTQLTSTSTAVISNANAGVITCFTSTLAGVTAVQFTVNNSYVGASSAPQVSICGYSGTYVTNGCPVVSTGAVANGSFVVNVVNVHATVALAGVLKIAYQVN
jgi:hypothetical protein